ncbi:RNA polymerase alpha subunit domain protein [Pirellula staleyi DSM 6068]|uniref:RNA polymerase alpha subunit domain protein n=1 Tax=Pirellula staleyi (strain ATCC 27377 / DSM 6068 / ICPB 4128) TaxID=530564 RepID=D2R234_PIRSD|nr:DNA-directed RNA polymerase subunit alpha C-terminal domain-containing protein [Pirellula staleyi]ADB18645.1 RNA polymerase alpha subunit domain protein [Pirellula staleyi DSM 6068]
MASVQVDIRDIVLSNSSFGPREITNLSQTIAEDYAQFGVLRDAVGELEVREDRTPAAAVRLGVCYYLLGRYRSAAETLSSADGGAVAHYYLGKTRFAMGQYADAIKAYAAAKVAGYNSDDTSLATAEAQRYEKQPQKAIETLDKLSGAVEQTAEYLYQRGATVAALGGSPVEVVALFERAVEADGRHPGALFGLAVENDRHGNDELALQLYQRAAGTFPTNVGTLINLGILYEDRQAYDRAQQCYNRVLEAFPEHPRARLYSKDAAASGNMLFDEEAQRRNDRLAQVLSIPVTDFELSVRSRNCLQKMGVRTLGDLTRTSEQELLASKNFGETSLVEIRDMLHSKGLELGQFAAEKAVAEPVLDLASMSPDEQALLERPISELNLSVRARKCMARLGLTLIGELVRKTGDDLLECKNFGVTSLNEVREKLTTLGIKLRGD